METKNTRKLKFLFGIGVFVIIAILAIILTFPDYFMYPGTDYGVYFNNGRLISKGYIPYKDFWDHKTPGISIYLALWQTVFGSGWFSAKASIISIYILWGISIFILSRIVFRRNLLAIISATIGVYFVLRPGFDPARNGAILILSTSVELMALSLVFLITTQIAGSHTKRYRIVIGTFAGILSSVPFLIRQTSITPFLVFGFTFFIGLITKKEHSIKPFLGYFAIGALIPFLIAALVAKAVGLTVADVYKPVVLFNILYTGHRISLTKGMYWVKFFLTDILWWTLTLIGAICLINNEKNPKNTHIYTIGLKFIYLCLGVAVSLTVFVLKPESFYRIQYMAYLIIVSCAIISSLIKNYSEHPSLVVRTTTLVLLGFFILGSIIRIAQSDIEAIRKWYKTAYHFNFQVKNFPDQVIAEEILSRKNGGKIFVYGNRAWIYTLTDSFSPNEHYYASGIFWDGYLSQSEFDSIYSQLELEPPEIIVYWPNYPKMTNSYYNSSYIARFENFVRLNYLLDKEITFEYAWPYALPDPIEIYTLVQD